MSEINLLLMKIPLFETKDKTLSPSSNDTQSPGDDPAHLFDSGKVNDNAKYMPKILKAIKNATHKAFDFSKIFKMSSKLIPGTDIPEDANSDEREADDIMRRNGDLQ